MQYMKAGHNYHGLGDQAERIKQVNEVLHSTNMPLVVGVCTRQRLTVSLNVWLQPDGGHQVRVPRKCAACIIRYE